MPPPPPVHAESLARALALIVAILAAVRRRLRLPAAGDERRQAVALGALSGGRLRIRLLLRLILGAALLLVARRKGLRVARQIGLTLSLRRLRRVARLVLAHERLVVVAVVEIVAAGLAGRRLLALLVIGVLLAELLLRGGDQAEIMFGVLVVVLGRHRIAGALRITRELDVFFRDVRGRASDLHVGSVRLIDPRQRVLALAVTIVC